MVHIDPKVLKRGISKETKEHPTIPKKYIKVLATNHIVEYGARAYPKKRKR